MFLACSAAIADDAVVELSKHLGKTPALVVVVCDGDEGDLPTIAGLVEQDPMDGLLSGHRLGRAGQDSRLGRRERALGRTGLRGG